jgi:uncharacterized membrane protein YeiH
MKLIHLDALFFIVEFLGVFAGALSGGLSAIRHPQYKYDWVGVLGLAFVTALGGGITRDVILQHGVPLAFNDVRYILISLGGALVAIVFEHRMGPRVDRGIDVVDAAALGFFAIAGTTRALNDGLNVMSSILLGLVTAVGGGSLRDVLCGRTPHVFERGQLYAIAALCGSATFLLCNALELHRATSTIVGTLTCFLVRLLSVRYNWRTEHIRGRAALS